MPSNLFLTPYVGVAHVVLRNSNISFNHKFYTVMCIKRLSSTLTLLIRAMLIMISSHCADSIGRYTNANSYDLPRGWEKDQQTRLQPDNLMRQSAERVSILVQYSLAKVLAAPKPLVWSKKNKNSLPFSKGIIQYV